MAKKAFEQPLRGLLQTVAVLIALGLLAIPPVVVVLSGTASADALWTALRIAGLEAFVIIFANIVIGSFRPFFNRLVGPRLALRVHTVTGATGFSVAVAHGALAFAFGIAGYRPGALWVGPVALAVLAAVIDTAIMRARLKRIWRWIHRLNYAIFVAVLVHASLLGADLRSNLFLRVCAGVFAAMVAGGLAYRIAEAARQRKAAAERKAG